MSLDLDQQLRLTALISTGSPAEREHATHELLADFRAPAMAVISRALRAANVGLEHAEEAFEQAAFKFFAVGLQRASAPRAYFVRSALNAAVDIVRSLGRHGSPALDDRATVLSSGGDELAEPFRRLQLQKEIAALRSCLQRLDDSSLRAVQAYYLEERGSCAECAVALGISRASLMKRLERARQALARCLERLLGRGGHDAR